MTFWNEAGKKEVDWPPNSLGPLLGGVGVGF